MNPDFAQMLQSRGDWSANIVITLNRNGDTFSPFFRSLFADMRLGTSMPMAWAKLAPQGPQARSDIPGTLCLLEAGHIAFGVAKHAGREEFQKLLRESMAKRYSNGSELQYASLLSALGALAGFASQEGLRQKFVIDQKLPEEKIFSLVKTKSNETFYFGDNLNHVLLAAQQGQNSVWSIVAAGAQLAGAKQLPDIGAMAKRNAQCVGNSDYGVLELIPGHPIHATPLAVLQESWHAVRALLQEKTPDPAIWGMEIAVVAHQFIVQFKDAVDPSIAARIVMEPAVSMSKINPQTVVRAGVV